MRALTKYRFEEVRAALQEAWGLSLHRGGSMGDGKHDGRWDQAYSRTGFIVSGNLPGRGYDHRRYALLGSVARVYELDRVAKVLNFKSQERKSMIRLTARQRDLLYHQLADDYWLTPMKLGGTDGSHHSATLAQLARKGLVERRSRGGHTRNAWEYRRTPAGKAAVDE